MVEELEVLYRERLGDFTRAATAIAGDEESGRDAVQEAFAKALRKRRRFRGEGNLGVGLADRGQCGPRCRTAGPPQARGPVACRDAG